MERRGVIRAIARPNTSPKRERGNPGDGASTGNDSEYSAYENTLIESPSTQAKMASIQTFQSTEPERPVLGEPVPKGSYLDIEA